MRKIVFILFAFALTLSAGAQDKKAKTKKAKSETAWKAGGSISVLGGLGSSNRHYSGLIDDFAGLYGGYVKLYLNKSWSRNVFRNSIWGGYMRSGKGEGQSELNENKIEFLSRYGYKLKNAKWQVGTFGNLRTQIQNGFDYSYSTPKRTSGFFAPAIITAGAGVNYDVCKSFNVFAGPAVRWITVTNRPYSLVYQGGIKPDNSPEPTLASLYNVDPEKQVRYETGLLISGSFKHEFGKSKKVVLKSRLDLMNDVREKIRRFDVYNTTSLSVSLGKWFTITGNFDIIYDKDINKDLMYRGMAGFGAICRF